MKLKLYLKSKQKCPGKRNHGVALIMAVIIITILIIFTFSLTLIAYTLYSSQNKNIASLRCSEAANSLSRALGDELTNSSKNHFPEKYSNLYKYLRYNICQDDTTWPYYVSEGTVGHNRDVAVRYFDLRYNSAKTENVEGLPGRTEVAIYWMLPEGVNTDDMSSAKSDLSDKDGIRLIVEVTCEAASQSYTVTSEFVLDVATYNEVKEDRHDALIGGLTDVRLNPCSFTAEEICDTQLWIWKPVVED